MISAFVLGVTADRRVSDSGTGGYRYTARLSGTESIYRVRSFYDYRGVNDYYDTSYSMYGLYVHRDDTDGDPENDDSADNMRSGIYEVSYDDWDCPVRPPRIDDKPTVDKRSSRNFNAEIIPEFTIHVEDDSTYHDDGTSDSDILDMNGRPIQIAETTAYEYEIDTDTGDYKLDMYGDRIIATDPEYGTPIPKTDAYGHVVKVPVYRKDYRQAATYTVYAGDRNGNFIDLYDQYYASDILFNEFTPNFGGYSALAPSATGNVNPLNFVIEYLDSDVQIREIKSVDNIVTVTTVSAHGFKTGDVIYITGIPTGSVNSHILGYDGERYMGSYEIVVTSSRTFKYHTEHYTEHPRTYKASGIHTMRAEKWVVDYYREIVEIPGVSSAATTMTFDISQVPGLSGAGLSVGDRVSFGDIDVVDERDWGGGHHPMAHEGEMLIHDAEVTELVKDGDRILVTVNLDAIGHEVEAGDYFVYYSPRTPSGSIPANYNAKVDNSAKYSHMENTFMVAPSVDTYFSSVDSANHTFEKSMLVSGKSMACLKYAIPRVPSGTDVSGSIEFHVDASNFSSCRICGYQIKTDRWFDSYTYSDMVPQVSDTVIGEFTVETDGNAVSTNPMTITIPGEFVHRWLSGYDGYPASIALFVMDEGNPEVKICSMEGEYPSYLRISGGEKAMVDPAKVEISPVPSFGYIGDTVRLNVLGGLELSASAFTYTVKIGGQKATIVGGTQKYIDVIVPKLYPGQKKVTVYRNGTGDRLVEASSTALYTVGDSGYSRNVKLADKLNPGTIGESMSRTAVYDRDLAYNGFTEITDENALLQNVLSILLTNKGERMFNPTYGTTIAYRVFELMDDANGDNILKECISAVQRYEPRVTIDPDRSAVDFDMSTGSIYVSLGVVMPSGNARSVELTFAGQVGR